MPGQKDLFPKTRPTARASDPTVTVRLYLHRASEGDRGAWLLSTTGMERDAKWVPKAICRPAPDRADHYTLPRSVALSREWI